MVDRAPHANTTRMFLGWLLSLLLFALAGCGAERIATLSTDLQHDDVSVRRAAARRLADMGHEANAAVPALSKAMSDKDHEVRRLAIYALTRVSMPDKSFLPQLTEALQDEELSVRIAAAMAINRIDPREEQHQEVLIDAMKSGEGGIIVSVGHMGDAAVWAVPTLTELLADRRAGIRRIAANSLEQIGHVTGNAREALQRVAANDPDQRARDAAKQALQTIELRASSTADERREPAGQN